MKLYTEKQVRKSLNDCGEYFIVNMVLEKMKPIELPSDEEIKEYVYINVTPPCLDKGDGAEQMYYDSGFYDGFKDCALWMKEQILNQNK